jgi:RND family efflux transporter MFP subunit
MKAFSIILCVWTLVACEKQVKTTAETPKFPAATVSVSKVVKQQLQLSEEITGTVRAKTRAVIEAKISGRLLTLNTTLGQSVRSGEVLATLDAQEMLARLQSAQALMDQAGRDEQRAASLVGGNAISKADYDSAKARLEVAKAAVSEAQTMMGYAKVTAPFDGVITRKLADQGDFAAPGKPLLELESPKDLRVEADIPEALIGNLKLEAAVSVYSATDTILAKVAEISPAGDPNSRTFPIKLDLPADSKLHLGQFVRLAVPVRNYDALLIPPTALVQRGQLQMVFVNDKNVARLRLVRVGRTRNEGIEVLSGLEGGESLVITEAATLQDGQPLTIKP